MLPMSYQYTVLSTVKYNQHIYCGKILKNDAFRTILTVENCLSFLANFMFFKLMLFLRERNVRVLLWPYETVVGAAIGWANCGHCFCPMISFLVLDL